MAGPVLPSPFMLPQGPQKRDDNMIQQLLMSLLGTAGSSLIQAGVNRALPYQYPEQPPSLAQEGAMDFAQAGLSERGQWVPPDFARQFPGASREEVIQKARRTGPARLEEQIAAEQEATAAATREAAVQDAMSALGQDEDNGPQLQNAFRMAMSMREAGMDVSTVNSFVGQTLPETEAQRLDNLLTTIEIEQTNTQVEADAVATTQLKARGLLPGDAPEAFPGAAEWYRDMMKAERGEQVDWSKRIADHVFSRVGDSISGMDPMVQMGAIMSGAADPSDFAGGVSVEDAIAEAVSIARTLDPRGSEGAISSVESGRGRRLIDQNLARLMVDDILASDPSTPVTDIRRALREDGFTDTEIAEILRARQRDRSNAR